MAGALSFGNYAWNYQGRNNERQIGYAKATVEALAAINAQLMAEAAAPQAAAPSDNKSGGFGAVADGPAYHDGPVVDTVAYSDTVATTAQQPQVIVVTATPTPVPPLPQIEYIYETVIITEPVYIEVTPLPLPTITPVPLAPGVVSICASVEGASALYIGGQGVVSGECRKFSFGVGQTSIQVQINK